MKVSAIWAQAKNRVIGKNNDIPWYLPADLKYFKKLTLNHHIIMGRKTYESIGKPLPKRTNIIVTRNPFYIVSNCIVTHSIDEALELAQENGEDEVFIIGGSEIYKQAMPYLDCIYLTQVDKEIDGDTYAPELDETEWELKNQIDHLPDLSSEGTKTGSKNEYAYSFITLERKYDLLL